MSAETPVERRLPEPLNRTVLDFPTAWAIQEAGGLTHHPRCSSVPGWHALSGPGLLCDCGAVRAEWTRLLAAGGEKGT
jgi:hypothetical protein